MLRANGIAGELADLHAVLRLGAFLAQVLALFGGKLGEEIIEAGVAFVVPVELRIGAQQPAGFLEQRQLRRFDERGVGGGKPVLLADLLGDAQKGDAERRVLARQQARAGGRGEGHADLELGVVLPAGTVPGIGPAVIEDIFALAVALQIGGQSGSGDACGILDHQRKWRPPAAPTDAARFLEQCEESVAGEGIAGSRKRVPLIGGNLADSVMDARGDAHERAAFEMPAPSAIGPSPCLRARSIRSGVLTVHVSTGKPRRRWAPAKRLGMSVIS